MLFRKLNNEKRKLDIAKGMLKDIRFFMDTLFEDINCIEEEKDP